MVALGKSKQKFERFGTDDNGNFDCEECSEVLGKLFALVEAGARSPQEMRKRTQKELKESGISCCEVVKMLDVNDPNKTILHQQATAMKLNIEELACLKCNAYINYILEHFKPKD
ncbi:10335_t:CDS:2 [Funneliformis geosporum]|nr:10335_t:CDS:2 [Funneliformis geosporum]